MMNNFLILEQYFNNFTNNGCVDINIFLRDIRNSPWYFYMSARPKKFICNVCSKRFRLSTDLISHKNTHLGLKPYKCTICERSYPSQKSLNEHGKIHSQKTFECDHCKRIFFYNYKLLSHKKKCQKYLVCECGKRYRRISFFLKHIRQHTKKETQFLGTQMFSNEESDNFPKQSSETVSIKKTTKQKESNEINSSIVNSFGLSNKDKPKGGSSNCIQYQENSKDENSSSRNTRFIQKKYVFACQYCKKKFETRKLKDTHVHLTHRDIHPSYAISKRK